MFSKRLISWLAALLILPCAVTEVRAGLITVDTSAFVGVPSRFNGFESIPNFPMGSALYYSSSPPYTYDEGGIRVDQFDSIDGLIRVDFFHPQGIRGWYPEGGDDGYTQITTSEPGGKFTDVGFNVATGFSSGSTLHYRILNDGLGVVPPGTLPGVLTEVGIGVGYK